MASEHPSQSPMTARERLLAWYVQHEAGLPWLIHPAEEVHTITDILNYTGLHVKTEEAEPFAQGWWPRQFLLLLARLLADGRASEEERRLSTLYLDWYEEEVR